jgi:predicted RecA/RadA family phage recombinase
MSKFETGDLVRKNSNPQGGTGTVLAWDDPRCPFAPEDWSGHAVVAWDDDTVTTAADGSLSLAAQVSWDDEAQEPDE